MVNKGPLEYFSHQHNTPLNHAVYEIKVVIYVKEPEAGTFRTKCEIPITENTTFKESRMMISWLKTGDTVSYTMHAADFSCFQTNKHNRTNTEYWPPCVSYKKYLNSHLGLYQL